MAGTTLTEDMKTQLRGKMNVEIAAMVAAGELSKQAAGEFLLERATAKATRKGLIGAPTAA